MRFDGLFNECNEIEYRKNIRIGRESHDTVFIKVFSMHAHQSEPILLSTCCARLSQAHKDDFPKS